MSGLQNSTGGLPIKSIIFRCLSLTGLCLFLVLSPVNGNAVNRPRSSPLRTDPAIMSRGQFVMSDG